MAYLRSIIIMTLTLSGLTACSSGSGPDVDVNVPKCTIDQPVSPGCNHSPTEENSH